jgi:hypothetical protein
MKFSALEIVERNGGADQAVPPATSMTLLLAELFDSRTHCRLTLAGGSKTYSTYTKGGQWKTSHSMIRTVPE